MRVNKVKHYKTPDYPTREEILSDSTCLKESVPGKWKSNKIVTAALAFFLLGEGNSRLNADLGLRGKVIVIDEERNPGEIDHSQKNELKNDVISVAPLFIHGDGRGAFGCVVINPPAFMSEEEGRQIIEEELMKENIMFDKKNIFLDEVVYERQNTFEDEKADTVKLDGYSSKYNLGYEFIGVSDYHNFGGEWSGSTVQNYDVIEASQTLREKMKEYGKINTVIFYDPMEHQPTPTIKNNTYNDMQRWENAERLNKQETETSFYRRENSRSIEQLKRQVHDFIDWIKKEGLLKEK